MSPIIIFILVVVAAVLLLMVFAQKDAKKYGTKTSEELVGLAKAVFDRTLKKQANLDKIMNLLATSTSSGQAELSNAEIRQALKVSSRTAVRYLDELEKQGKVEQIGKTGQTVTYRLKN